jgi:indole-3-glycerol phosphate synthase
MDGSALARLHRRARELDLDVLVEVHDPDELHRALDAGARIVGVNNRNLRTLAVDVGISERLAPAVPRHVTAVAESGLRTTDDLRRLRDCGYRAFLVGERLMTARDPGEALARLLGTPPHAAAAPPSC